MGELLLLKIMSSLFVLRSPFLAVFPSKSMNNSHCCHLVHISRDAFPRDFSQLWIPFLLCITTKVAYIPNAKSAPSVEPALQGEERRSRLVEKIIMYIDISIYIYNIYI